MSRLQKIKNFISGLIVILYGMLVIALVYFYGPVFGLSVIIAILATALLIKGANILRFYSTMARHMVGGQRILYVGFIVFCFGLLTMSIKDLHPSIIIGYLFALHAFEGGVDVAGALSARKNGAKHWRVKLIVGILTVIFGLVAAVAGFVFKATSLIAVIYGIGIIISGCSKIRNSFTKTEVVYIQ
jgi:uncharacterized membrane protein HdeD (DUF308 family)